MNGAVRYSQSIHHTLKMPYGFSTITVLQTTSRQVYLNNIRGADDKITPEFEEVAGRTVGTSPPFGRVAGVHYINFTSSKPCFIDITYLALIRVKEERFMAPPIVYSKLTQAGIVREDTVDLFDGFSEVVMSDTAGHSNVEFLTYFHMRTWPVTAGTDSTGAGVTFVGGVEIRAASVITTDRTGLLSNGTAYEQEGQQGDKHS